VDKPVKAKPHFYAVCLLPMQELARGLGYNLLVHGSMNRDLDLIAVPWIDEPKTHLELLQAICDFLGVPVLNDVEHYMFSVLPGNRSSYIINLNRGGKFNSYVDEQYYLDISITPLLKPGND